MTAPLWFVKYSDDADVDAGYTIAEVLHADPDPLVHKPVGHLPRVRRRAAPRRFDRFLAEHGDSMARPAYRLANRKRR